MTSSSIDWANGAVEVHRDGPVTTVRLSRPEAKNAVDQEVHRRLADVWAYVASDPAARVVILAGTSGGAFCAGGDLGWFSEISSSYHLRREVLNEGRRLITEMLSCPLPVIAAVDGAAVGLGASLVALADISLMSRRAFLSDPHVGVGLVAADGGAVVWPVLASLLRIREHLFLGERIGAGEAVSLGLASRVVDGDSAEVEARQLAERLAALPPQALQATKRALNIHIERAVHDVLPYAFSAESETFLTSEHQAIIERYRSAGR